MLVDLKTHFEYQMTRRILRFREKLTVLMAVRAAAEEEMRRERGSRKPRENR